MIRLPNTVISAGSYVFAEDNPRAKVIVYYFHGSFRCVTCTAMEKYSREAVEINFKDALASGRLEFKAVNVEDRGNEHFADDFKEIDFLWRRRSLSLSGDFPKN